VTELYEGWYSAMVRFASRSFGNLELAEEVVQDAFMELYKELAGGRQIEHPRAWVMRVVRRRIWRQFGAPPDDQLEHEPLEVVDSLRAASQTLSEDAGELSVLLNCLSPREEEAVLLRASGLDYAEIAAELRLSSGTVGTLLSRALRKMQQVAQSPPGSGRVRMQQRKSDAQTLQ
jgi:RNA polymerase sigma factor (sigma-70 family)